MHFSEIRFLCDFNMYAFVQILSAQCGSLHTYSMYSIDIQLSVILEKHYSHHQCFIKQELHTAAVCVVHMYMEHAVVHFVPVVSLTHRGHRPRTTYQSS